MPASEQILEEFQSDSFPFEIHGNHLHADGLTQFELRTAEVGDVDEAVLVDADIDEGAE